MAMHLKERTCVARGAFNIYIFHPRWLGEHLMELPEGTECEFRADFNQPGLQAHIPAEHVTWTIRPDSVIASTDSLTVDCGSWVAHLLQDLPHTPLRAVGNNFTFECSLDETKLQKDLLRSFRLEQQNAPGLKHSAVSGSIERDGAVFNISLGRRHDSMTLGVNVHRESTSIGIAIKAAKSFQEDYAAALEMTRDVFGLEIDDDKA